MQHLGTRPSRAGALAFALALGTTACGDGDSSATTTTVGSTTATTTADTSTTTAPDDTTTTTTTAEGTLVEVTFANGAVEGGVQRTSVALGDTVTLRVTSDIADEVHVHTYDIMKAVDAGGTVDITFAADIPGVIEVELENAGLRLVELQIG